MVTESPNAKYDHVYAIIRVDRDALTGGMPDKNLVMVKKVVRSKEVADQEVERLNRLNADKGCEYYYQITRLEREPQEQSEEATTPSETRRSPKENRGASATGGPA